MHDDLLVEHGTVLRLRLNRPSCRNALTPELVRGLAESIESAAKDPAVRVISLEGVGGHFCAGADLQAITGLRAAETAALMADANRVMSAIVHAPQIVTALVRGAAAGFGASLAFAADLVVASDTATFSIPFTQVGVMPDGGVTTAIAASAGRATATRLALLGDRLTAHEAAAHGLVARVVDSATFDQESDGLLDLLCAGPAAAYASTKEALRRGSLSTLDTVLAYEALEQSRLLLTPDFAEGAAAFTQRRAANFGGTSIAPADAVPAGA